MSISLKRLQRWPYNALLFLGALVLLFGYFSVKEYLFIRAQGVFASDEATERRLSKRAAVFERLGREPEAKDIRPWMTFKYLNDVFKLPDNYFAEFFNIQHSNYPNLTIAEFAKSQSQSPSFITRQVQTAVSSYSHNITN